VPILAALVNVVGAAAMYAAAYAALVGRTEKSGNFGLVKGMPMPVG
jgi:hypothetical protein